MTVKSSTAAKREIAVFKWVVGAGEECAGEPSAGMLLGCGVSTSESIEILEQGQKRATQYILDLRTMHIQQENKETWSVKLFVNKLTNHFMSMLGYLYEEERRRSKFPKSSGRAAEDTHY